MNKKETAKATEAIRAGRVELPNPKASECLPVRADVNPITAQFHYFKVDPVPASHMSMSVRPGLHVEWGIKGFGFGEVSIYQEQGKWVADTEGMGDKFLLKVLITWAGLMLEKENGEPKT